MMSMPLHFLSFCDHLLGYFNSIIQGHNTTKNKHKAQMNSNQFFISHQVPSKIKFIYCQNRKYWQKGFVPCKLYSIGKNNFGSLLLKWKVQKHWTWLMAACKITNHRTYEKPVVQNTCFLAKLGHTWAKHNMHFKIITNKFTGFILLCIKTSD